MDDPKTQEPLPEARQTFERMLQAWKSAPISTPELSEFIRSLITLAYKEGNCGGIPAILGHGPDPLSRNSGISHRGRAASKGLASRSSQMEAMNCPECGDIGMVRRQVGERWVSGPCSCQEEAGAQARIRRAKIPAGFEHATLEGFKPGPQTEQALLFARRYVEEFLPANNRVTDSQAAGMLFTGSVGTGKTHLAAGIAQAIARRGFQPLFVDLRELLERLKRTYDAKSQETQGEVLNPIWAADLVVIDELGAQRPTDWSFETLELLIGGLYNRATATIVTTNLPNKPPGGTAAAEEDGYRRAARTETLGDRIGARMFSRLQQMCRPVEMAGPDWRTKRG